MRNVVSAVKIVVDEDLPVAGDVVGPRGEIMQLTNGQGCDSPHQSTKKVTQRSSFRVEIDEHEFFPNVSLYRNQAILLTVEIIDAIELRHAFEGTV